jgi:hypothetical protein
VSQAQPPIGWIREVVLDCFDPWQLSRFWAAVVGGDPVEWYDGWVTLEPAPHGQRLSFQRVRQFRQPTWASPTLPAQVHVDVLVDDLEDADRRVRALGARPLGDHVSPRRGPTGERIPWRVYADPAGHPFCLVVR